MLDFYKGNVDTKAMRNKKPTKENSWRMQAYRLIKAVECAHCGATSGLQRHHIDEDITHNDPSNLMILCGPCHRLEHVRLGTKVGRNPKITENQLPVVLSHNFSAREAADIVGVSLVTIYNYRNKHWGKK